MSDDAAKSIKLNLRKSYYQNYLRFIFSCPEGPIKINRDEDLGKYLFSRVRSSDTPVKPVDGYHVDLILPVHSNDCTKYHFAYYSAEDMVRINDFIEATAYQDFRMMVQAGTIDLKMDRKTVISVFSDLIFGEDKFEMLKKDEYRKRRRLLEWLQLSAKQLGYK